MDVRIIILILFISIYRYIEVIYAKKYYDILPKSTVCRVLATDIVHDYTCETKINRTTHSMTRVLNFQLGITLHNYHANIQLYRKYGTQYRPFMFKLDQDMCLFLGGNHTRENILLMRFFNPEARRKYGNFYDPCPLSGRRFELNYKSDYSLLPDIFPAAEYKFDMISYTYINGVKRNFVITQAFAEKYIELLPEPTVCRVLATDIVYNYTCVTKMVNRTTRSMSRELNFQLGVSLNNFHVNLQLHRKYGTQFRPFMVKVDQDMCSILGGNHTRNSSLLMKMFSIDKRRKYGNFYDPCPLSGRRFELDYKSDYSMLPDIFPAAEYRFDMTSYTFVNGVKTNFIITQNFAEVRSKT